MPNIANVGHVPILFRDKAGEIVELAPGTAENVDVDRTHPVVAAYENARLIKVGGTKAQAEKKAREKAYVPPADTPVTE